MNTKTQQQKKILTTQSIKKQILYWNINTINNVLSYSSLIDRSDKNLKPNQHDYHIRDFYFTQKLTINGLFQPSSFIEKSVPYLENFSSLDKNSYLQSINFQNNIKKFRFWKNLLASTPKDQQTLQAKQYIKKILLVYRFPIFTLFAVATYIFMFSVDFTKMKKGKQIATLAAALYIADILIQRRKGSDIFYQIPKLKSQELEKKRIQLINESVILDGNIYKLDKKLSLSSNQLIQQAKQESDQKIKKQLLEAAGFQILDSSDKIF